MLFVYDALKTNADLVILDDPISSFDKNKKYAIIDMLFKKGDKALSGKTVLLLTHDFEPIIDMVFHHRDRFDVPSTWFLENTYGNLTEKAIEKDNIKTFIDICNENIDKNVNNITKLVYLRRYYEVINEKNAPYHLISNLLHKRDVPHYLNSEQTKMTQNEIDSASTEIATKISGFNYTEMLKAVNDDIVIKKLYNETSSNYEKLHLFRIFVGDDLSKTESTIIAKFINEAFHIENDYIYQLNPCEYQLVPQYVIDECNKQMLMEDAKDDK